ncbi:hypothetical protein [Mycolicibacterium sphagni]|uniref:Transmembrane protein n=1 Tax=Mycolicibacterium sphagni TaxID=1786 RepID=A0ABX2K0G7_9MYCO|nr:hypothetical protein [Mycolicibacterium sphagni]NTY59730.1 hypothetical protein [Mycolicibacterium sphagni]
MRVVVTAAHLALWVLSAALYFLFVLPRWWELMGDTSHTLGTVLRIVTGVLIALTALPVLLTLLRNRDPDSRTPPLAQRLRVCSVILYVLAGVLIIGTAVSEIWVSLDKAGPWLFGVYGAAAAIAILALLTSFLGYTAEQPAKAPKPKKEKKKRGKAAEAEEADEADGSSDETAEADGPVEIEETAAIEETAIEAEASSGVLLNKRPTGKTNRRLRRRDRVTVDEPE